MWFFHFFFAFSENLNFIFLFFQAQEPRPGPSISKEASEESKTDSSSEMDNVYHVKWIGWNSKKTPIITQNSNGPCPMLAITNVLLLKGRISLPEGCEVVSSEQLLENLGVYLFIKVCSHWWNMWWVHSRKYPKNLNKIYYFVKKCVAKVALEARIESTATRYIHILGILVITLTILKFLHGFVDLHLSLMN